MWNPSFHRTILRPRGDEGTKETDLPDAASLLFPDSRDVLAMENSVDAMRMLEQVCDTG